MLSKGALTGITVLDLSRLLPGPYCSMILADHGARVIAIEDKKQYATDGLFLPTVQRNKEHISLDLKTDAGKEIFFRLVQDADVVIEGFRPGVVQRLGVDYQSIRAVKNDIIYCSITGYGQTGAARNRVGHDINYLGDSGVLDLIGHPDQPPVIPGIQIADIAGGLNGAIGILLALHARQHSGRGQQIDISMTDGVLAFLPVAQYALTLGESPRRGDNMLSHRFACYNTYATADGRYMAVGALENRFWRALCKAMDLEQFADLQYEEGRRTEIIEAFRAKFMQHPASHWQEMLGPSELCVSCIRTLEEALAAPMFQEREMVTQLTTSDGSSETALGIPVKLSETPGTLRSPSVGFSESTGKVLKEIGYTEEQIKELLARGVI